MASRSLSGALLMFLTLIASPVRAQEAAIAIRAGHVVDTAAGRMRGAQTP